MCSTNESFSTYRLKKPSQLQGVILVSRLPSLSGLRAFEAAARNGSFKHAAAELSVTPGAISLQIKNLEADLGVRLFLRRARSVELTPEGEELHPVLTSAFGQIRAATDRVRPSRDVTSIRINSSGPVITKWLLPILHDFTQRNPDVQVNIETEIGLSELTPSGPDIVIRYTSEKPKDLLSLELHPEVLIPVASPDLLTRKKISRTADILKAPILFDTSFSNFGLPSSWDCWSKAAGLDNQALRQDGITFQRHAADQVIDAAIAGSGIALGRSLLAHNALSDGRLVSPFGPVISSGLKYFVCCAAGRENETCISDFMRWSVEQVSELNALYAVSDVTDEPSHRSANL